MPFKFDNIGRRDERRRLWDRSSQRWLLAAILLFAAASASAPAQGLFGPGKFHVEQSDDRFSTSGMMTRTGLNNRVTKKAAGGGMYLDYRGLYLDPIVVKVRDTGAITKVGFIVHHETTDDDGGAINAIGAPRKLSFLLPDGKLIQADVRDSESKFGRTDNYNRYTHSASTNISESGIVSLSLDDMQTLAQAPSVTINIEGEKRSWTIEAKDVSKSFLQNVSSFYALEIAANSRAAQ